jgi:hypothetical protein
MTGSTKPGARPRRLERIFLLRVWREAGAPADDVRLRVTDLSNQTQLGFKDPSELAGALRDLLEATG